MTTQFTGPVQVGEPAERLRQKVQSRIAALSYLPTTAAVAIKFVELGKDPEAEPNDYAKIISADSSLSSKLLALANSSWAGVRNKVTTAKMAVNLLGLGTVRTLAISYCMTGLHNELRLSPSESQLFWESALCKAVAAKRYASLFDVKLGDEAFVAGLFQDFAMAVMYSVVREPYVQMLQDPQVGIGRQLERERELFGVDHAEVGRALAQKLELPELFVDTTAFHHSYERLSELIETAPLRDAAFVAGLLPHAVNAWHPRDAEALGVFLHRQAASTDLTTFLAEVQGEFGELYAYFNEGHAPQAQLIGLLEHSAREVADNTTALVHTVNELLRDAAQMGAEVTHRVHKLEDKAQRDQLTGVLNRQGLAVAARDALAKAARYGTAFAVCYLDLDRFKSANDTHGHAYGDFVLREFVGRIAAELPCDALCGRMGGDEFVVLLPGVNRQEALTIAERMVAAVAARPFVHEQHSRPLTISAGLLFVRPSNQVQALDTVLNAADKLMYAAKRGGGNRVEVRVV